jgi:hypothetical protein
LVLGQVFANSEVNAQHELIIGTKSDGRIEITIYSLNTSVSISYSPYTSDLMGYIWAWIDFSITNLGGSTMSANPLNCMLKDQQNFIYDISNVSSPKQMQSQELSAEATIRGELYFEIPFSAVITHFVYEDDDSYITINGFPTPNPSPSIAPTAEPAKVKAIASETLYIILAGVIVVAITVSAFMLRKKKITLELRLF